MDNDNPFSDEGFFEMLRNGSEQAQKQQQNFDDFVRQSEADAKKASQEYRQTLAYKGGLTYREKQELTIAGVTLGVILFVLLAFLLRRRIVRTADAVLIGGLATSVRGSRRISAFVSRTRDRVLEKADRPE